MYLPDGVVDSEFPGLSMQSKDGKTAVLSFDNGEKVIISKQNSDGTTDSEVYNFKAVTDETVFPPVPDLPNYWHNVDLDEWNGVIDSNFKDSLKSNNDQIQKSINSLYEYETDQRNFFAKLKDTLSDFKGFVETIISAKTAEFLSKFSDQYYKKEKVDEKIDNLQKQIDNLSNAVNYKPQPNSVFPPGFTGEKDIDINDTIHDQNIEDKVEALNDIDEKGE
ncbi:hypothetical protein RF371_11510 [Companilactobacillus paralimentarius]|uniref:hypothetical protein n=1 Tax=Companilactobacillus paralimentarius TaxID=83526 RepID=UPI002852F76E|nr:hypothetical protein [Companilactobacillus paralimentarius]MDR4934418.1 hypothetical protein [Companilactobacillus paralimentarius]